MLHPLHPASGLRGLRPLIAAVLLLAAPTRAAAQADVLPPVPPYCEAGHSNEFNHGTQTASGSSYCLFRQVLDSYVTPPGGWSPVVGTFNIVTAYYPSSVWGGPPFSSNYPDVVLTYQRGNPNGYPAWDDVLYGFGAVPNALGDGFVSTGNEIELRRVFACEPTDFTCTYEIRPRNGTSPGDPPEWYAIGIAEVVDGNNPGLDLYGFAWVAAGIGLVGDGNRPPELSLSLIGSSDTPLTYLASLIVDDPDGDPITGYHYDWGDGQSTETLLTSASHTYAAPGIYFVRAYGRDAKGAVGFSNTESASSLFTVEVDAPNAVAVGEQIVVAVTLKNVGAADVNLNHTGGVASGQTANAVQQVSRPPVAATPVPRDGEYVGTWVFDTLRDATVRFNFGGRATIPTCPGCTRSLSVQHEVVIGNGIAATPTATAGGGATPTPTATPLIPALADPADAKLAVKCQAAIAKVRRSVQAAGLKGFDACGGKISKCVQTKPGDQACLDKAAAACGKVRDKLAAADGKLDAAIRKGCGALAPDHMFGLAGLGADGANAACVAHGVDPAGTLDGLIACQVAATACAVADVTEAEQPRLAQLLGLAGSDLGARTPCLDAFGGGGDVGDAKRGKVVDACRGAIAKTAQALVAARAKTAEACALAVLKCAQEKPGDAGCLEKAAATCAKTGPAGDAARAKLRDGITKKCGGLDFATLAAASGLGIGGLGARCANLGVGSLATLDDYVTCIERAAACTSDAATAVAIPRFVELLAAVGQPLVCQ